MNPETPHSLHRKAMRYRDRAYKIKNPIHTNLLFRIALGYEYKAASMLDPYEHQPTHAVLWRSAGWMAYKCDDYTKALECCKQGLINAPECERVSLEELLRKINK